MLVFRAADFTVFDVGGNNPRCDEAASHTSRGLISRRVSLWRLLAAHTGGRMVRAMRAACNV